MTTTTKWVVSIIIIAALAWLLWWSGWLKSAPQQVPDTQTGAAANAAPAQPDNGMSPTSDNSDAGIAKDTAAIDAQMQGLNNDSANIDSSLNDKPVTQSY